MADTTEYKGDQKTMIPVSEKLLSPIILAGSFTLCAATALAAPPGELPFGVYDPEGDFSDDPDVSIEHLFLPWEDVFLPSLFEADAYARERNRSVLVTIEPWTWTRSERNTPSALLSGINDGSYDENMRTICAILDDFESPVTVRWAHEMDDTSGQFIWAGWEPEIYIDAYRHMIDICREEAAEIDYMWSPLGFENMADYFPGQEYVDVVGLSVFGLQPWEREILGEEQSYRDILRPRYERALQFDLPIVVAEVGYVGDPNYVKLWQEDIRKQFEEFPELRAVVYFNQQEVYPWPDGYGLPNWTLGENVLTDADKLGQ